MSSDVTLAVAAIGVLLPVSMHTTAVGFVFLAATWLLVWRGDDERVRARGWRSEASSSRVSSTGRGPSGPRGRAASWAPCCGDRRRPLLLRVAPWWNPTLSFSLGARPLEAADEVLGQVFVIALPEEAFYRGYLQSRLDEVWAPRWGVLGARVGPGLVATATIFAVGHLATVQLPARLAVFFPALLFGWLRARTGGIGASVGFHAFCNVYSQALGRGYGLY